MAERERISPDPKFIKEIRKAGGEAGKKCYQCATCSVVCELSTNESPFPRKEMLWAQWGLADRLMRDLDIWACYQCNDCSVHCPRGAKPGDLLAAVRSYTYQNYAVPKFMGKALAAPWALPFLFAVPVIILFVLMNVSAPRTADGEFLFMQEGIPIDFNIFLPHSTVDAFFVLGNILIFTLAIIGFSRFWRDLKKHHGSGISLLTGVKLTIKEIFTHAQFEKCKANEPRYIGHILIFAGFVGAMITTGLVFVLIFIPHYIDLPPTWELPIDLPNPVKFIGAFSGLALLAGGAILIARRWLDKDEVGAAGYPDQLFIYIVFFTGLTGVTSWLGRWLVGDPSFAYINYFIHLVFVFFLLWYMPYSKFAHMIYRTLALVFLRAKEAENERVGDPMSSTT